MALLTPEQCRAQCRVDDEGVDSELLDLLASSEDAVSAYLNRAIFADEQALDEARAELPAETGTARTAYSDALSVAAEEADPDVANMMRAVAQARYDDQVAGCVRVLHGIAANGSILAAIRLTLGHLYANRESVAVGVSVAELPLGVKDMLRPYRRVMMP